MHRIPSSTSLRRPALRPALLAIAAVVGAACSESGTGPDEAVSVAFPPFPATAIVAGDTLRDASGAIVPLRAVAFNGAGDTIRTSAFTYFVRDTGTGLRVVTGGDAGAASYLVADANAPTRSVTLLASTAGLQITRPIQVVPRPDSLAPGSPTDTLFADTTAAAGTLLGGTLQLPLAVAVLHDSAGAAPVGVPSWIVDYELTASVASTLLDSVRFVDGTRVIAGTTTRDTSGAGGAAVATLRLFYDADVSIAPGTERSDSVVVLARARHRGAELRGSPVRFVVRIERRRRATAAR